jgi:hypothetical protein
MRNKGLVCLSGSCNEAAKCKGYCLSHYDDIYKDQLKKEICSVDDCNKHVLAIGLCSMHYNRIRTYGTTYRFLPPASVGLCQHITCTDLTQGKLLYCNAHNLEKRKKGYTTDKSNGLCQACGNATVEKDRRYKFCSDCKQFWHQLKHGVSGRQIREMIDRQNGRCAMCQKQSRLVIDHDHKCCPGDFSCGRCIRALLCHQCNLGIGNLQDDPALALIGAYYLMYQRHPKAKPEQVQQLLLSYLENLAVTNTPITPYAPAE